MEELKREDVAAFTNLMRVSPQMFQEIVQRLTPKLTANQRVVRGGRPPLPVGLKVAITLRFLATGDSYRSLQFAFRVANNSICKLVREVLDAIVTEMADVYIKLPKNAEEWKKVAQSFQERWNMPHAIGALDGKHVRVKQPKDTGSKYFNYKQFFSLILMALVDSNYQFLWIDVGSPGGCSDAQIFGDCELRDALDEETLPLPDPEPLPGDTEDFPYFILGDDAFPLRSYLMKPYARKGLSHEQLVYNYRISRARRVVENAFGILANHWQCLMNPLSVEIRTSEKIVIATCTLHNMLRQQHPTVLNTDLEDANHNLIPGAWRQGRLLEGLQITRGNKCTKAAVKQRELLREYFNSPAGGVPWQDEFVLTC